MKNTCKHKCSLSITSSIQLDQNEHKSVVIVIAIGLGQNQHKGTTKNKWHGLETLHNILCTSSTKINFYLSVYPLSLYDTMLGFVEFLGLLWLVNYCI